MSKYNAQIGELAELITSSDKPLADILSDIDELKKTLIISKTYADSDSYHLPYSSNPKPLDKRWETA